MKTDRLLTYNTIVAPTQSLFKDRGSKFLGYAFPIRNTDDVKIRLQELKKEHPKAVHHCFAYRIGTDGLQFRANDDGEPSGSAGKPILGQIDSAGLTNVLVVVVRYFGGTLLGVPGLIQAYKEATSLCFASAEIVEKDIEHIVRLSFDYSIMNEVMVALKQHQAQIYKQDMQLFCILEAGIPLREKDACMAKLSQIRNLEIL